MNIQIYSKGIELTDGLRTAVNETFEKVTGTNGQIQVTLCLRHGDHIVDAYTQVPGHGTVYSSASTNDMYVSIDEAMRKLEVQLEKIRSRTNQINRDDIRNYTDEMIDSE